jgi:hypothetical protein
LQKKTLLYVNHAVVTSSFYIIIQFGYMFGTTPKFPDASLNAFLCSFSEFFWPFSTYIRSYSILLIAVYRYLAVFKLNVFKKINSSYWYLCAPLLGIWLLAIAFPLLIKFSLQTSPSALFCLDGYSLLYERTILYFVFTQLLNVFVPSVSILTIYMVIYRKLTALKKNLNTKDDRGENHDVNTLEQESPPVKATTVAAITNIASLMGATQLTTRRPQTRTNQKDVNKEQRFANQFVLMCLSIILSGCIMSIFQLRNVIYNYSNLLYYWRPALRAAIEMVISLVPIIAIYYHPSRGRVLNKIKVKVQTYSS